MLIITPEFVHTPKFEQLAIFKVNPSSMLTGVPRHAVCAEHHSYEALEQHKVLPPARLVADEGKRLGIRRV